MPVFKIMLILFLFSFNVLIADQRMESAKEIASYKITATDYQNSIDYASVIDICGDWLIVGAPLADDTNTDEGCAYIYHWNGSSWSDECKIVASDADEEDQFGYSVAISPDMALVGAMYEDTRAANAGAVYAYYYNGADWIEQKLMASDGEAHNHFGESVDLDGTVAVVGAPQRGENGNQSGVIYTFNRSGNTWTQSEKLCPSDNAQYDYFGWSVTISDDWLAVGSTGNDQAGNSSGAVYFYQHQADNWLERDKVVAGDTENNDNLGYAVDIDGDYALISSINDDDNGPNSGSAYIFKRSSTSWLEQDKLLPSDGAGGDYFGNSVSLDGDYAIVGSAEHDNGDDLDCGSAYVFERDGIEWSQISILTADVLTAEDFFGKQVAISGSIVVVGCPGDDDNGNNSGSVFTYENNTDDFTYTTKVFASDGFAYRYFGSAIAMDGDWLIVGVPLDNDMGNEAGAAYFFHWTGSAWSEISKIIASDTEEGDQFGNSVAIVGQDFLIGAWHEDTNALNAGAVYYFKYNGSTWYQQKIIAPDGIAHNHFGYCVSWDNDMAVIGAPGCSDHGSQSGAVYITELIGSTWQTPSKLIPTDSQIYDYFGTSADIDNSNIIVGAHGVDDYGTSGGAAYIFNTVTKSETKLFSPDIAANDNFGKTVSIDGDYALISSINDDDNGPNSGSAYIFHTNGSFWNFQQKLVPASLQAGDYFGSSLNLSNNYAAVASIYHSNNNELEGGTVFVYELDRDNWNILAELSVTDPSDYDWFGKSVSVSGNRVAVGWIGNDDNGIDNGAAMVFHDIDTVTPLIPPEDVSISVDQSSGVDIYFEAVLGATGYKIYGSDTPTGIYADITSSGSFSQVGQQIHWSATTSENLYFFKITAIR
ncbi:MAG: hypothetical protein JW794_08950 [Candidatus Cloacimonetes bacterium]|nr:hypothetical protein [Candidatus Cloacimonadota bacterium]